MAQPHDERPSRVHRRTARFKAEASGLGQRIRELRERAGLTLEAAAERMDLNDKHLWRLEAGTLNPTLVTLVRIAVGLGVAVADLFGLTADAPGGRKRKRSASGHP